MKEEQVINRMQEIVKRYFDDVLQLPCPDFTFNYRENFLICNHQIKIGFVCQNCGEIVFNGEVLK